MRKKKLTINLDPLLIKALRVYAVQTEQFPGDVVKESLQQFFAKAYPEWQMNYIIMDKQDSE
jgi:hypothetical protein